MPKVVFKVASAAAVVGAELFGVGQGLGAKQAQNGNGVPRKIMAVACTGSTAPGDFAFDLYGGGKFLGSFMNTTGGAYTPKEADDWLDIASEDIVPANVTLIAMVTDAAAADAYIGISWEDRPVMGGGFRSDTMTVRGGGGGGGYRSRGSSGGYRKKTTRRRRTSY